MVGAGQAGARGEALLMAGAEQALPVGESAPGDLDRVVVQASRQARGCPLVTHLKGVRMTGAQHLAARFGHRLPVPDRWAGQARSVQALASAHEHRMCLWRPQQRAAALQQAARAVAQGQRELRLCFFCGRPRLKQRGAAHPGRLRDLFGRQAVLDCRLDQGMHADRARVGVRVDHHQPEARKVVQRMAGQALLVARPRAPVP